MYMYSSIMPWWHNTTIHILRPFFHLRACVNKSQFGNQFILSA